MSTAPIPAEQLSMPVLADDTDVDAYLAAQETRYTDIWPGAEKTVIWATSERHPTPLSVIYLHGYSACRQETAPLCNQVAMALGANLFYTRLHGHARPATHLAECRPEHWYADALEALAVGRAIGHRVVLVGCSTGATLATWLAMRSEAADSLQALVLISPNYGLRHPLAEALTTPLGSLLLRLVVGHEYTFEPLNQAHARYWSNRYPARALRPMMTMVKAVRNAPLERIHAPTLCLCNPNDQLINPQRIKPALARFSSQHRQIRWITPDDPNRHVLAGDILSPSSTDEVTREILAFLARLP